jgi:tRNA threonylcarbamoyladenosine biosynthesis protein TsaE
MIAETYSSEETFELGNRLGSKAKAGEIYTLTGDLGTGKTVFAQGFAGGLGITEYVNSPTFTILQVYDGGKLPFYHFDVYRIEDPEEMFEVGFDEYLEGDGVCLIEWAELVDELIPEGAVRIKIEKDLTRGTDIRKITIEE